MMLLTYLCLACVGGILILSVLYSPLHTVYVKEWVKFKEKSNPLGYNKLYEMEKFLYKE
jgi:hypothetical protein